MSLFPSMDRSTSSENALFIGGRAYPDPFINYASMLLPRTMEETLRWCEALWLQIPIYAAVSRRVVSYFNTEVDITDLSDEELKKQKKFLNGPFGIKILQAQGGESFMCYGNTFSSLYFPFTRLLRCQCSHMAPMSRLNARFVGFKFSWTCPRCGRGQTADRPIDVKCMDEERLKVIFWSPHEIRVMHHYIAKMNRYFWDIPPLFKRQIRDGNPFIVEYTPWEIIEAIKRNEMLAFRPGAIYHQAEYGLPGMNSAGWGVPRFLPNFVQAIYVQMLKLYNQTMAAEYLVPLRLMSPKQAGVVDPSKMSAMRGPAGFVNNMSAITRSFRRNPGGYYFSPHPVEYQVLGGEGMQMATNELVGGAMDEMLNAAGFPADLYKGSLTIQQTPIALRLFSASWPQYVISSNNWLRWLSQGLSLFFGWEQGTYALKPPTLADDLENKQLLLQLAAARQVSKSVAFAPLGVDPYDDLNRRLKEETQEAETVARHEQDRQQKQQLSQEAAGVGGASGQGGQSASVEDVNARADQEATSLLGMPEGDRRKRMRELKASDEHFWAIVKGKMQLQRQDAQQQGGQEVLRQNAEASA